MRDGIEADSLQKAQEIVLVFKALPKQRLIAVGGVTDMHLVRENAGPNVEILGSDIAIPNS